MKNSTKKLTMVGVILLVLVVVAVALPRAGGKGNGAEDTAELTQAPAKDGAKKKPIIEAPPVPATDGPAPKMVVEEAIHDFGKVDKGETLLYEFVIRNEGEGVLEIMSAKPSCGCTIVDYDKQIEPGKSGKVASKLDTSKFRGTISKYITVTTNDQARPQERLQLKAEVQAIIDILPVDRVDLRTTIGEPVSKSVTLRVNPNQELKVVSAESSLSYVTAKLSDMEPAPTEDEKPARQYKLDLSLADDAPEGRNTGKVVLKTDSTDHPEVEVMVWSNVEGVIFSTPATVYFGTIRKDTAQAVERKVTIRTRQEENSFKITDISSDSEFVQADVAPIEEGKRYTVTLKWDGQKLSTDGEEVKKGVKRGNITIKTDNSRQPSVVIPFTAYVL